MTNLQKFTIARIFSGAYFWIPIAPVYFISRGLSLEQVYMIVSIYSLAVVIFEYPTGILADALSHKKAVTIGFLITACAFILNAFPGNFYYYIGTFLLAAFGRSLRSGSDVALLHDISHNFKKDHTHTKSLALVASVCAIFVGGFLYKAHLILPYICTAIALFVSALFTIRIAAKDTISDAQSNIYAIASIGWQQVRKDGLLRSLLLFAGSFSAFFFSIKWFAPVLFLPYGVDESVIGFVLSMGVLILALGTKMSASKYSIRLAYAVPLLLASIALMTLVPSVEFIVGALFVVFFFRGFVETHTTVWIIDNVPQAIRASMLSLNGLCARLIMTGYVFVGGLVLGMWSSWGLGLLTLTLLGSTSAVAFLAFRGTQKKVLKGV